MELLPDEIREVIFDCVLQHDPDTLFSLRCISKTWKIFVDEYISRFPEWYNACKREIPKRCFTDLVQKIAPLNAYPWQDSFWMRSRKSNVPKDVYNLWKNLENPKLMETCKAGRFRYNDVNRFYHTFLIEDKYFVMSGKVHNVFRTRIFDMQDLGTPIRTFDNFSGKVIGFFVVNGTCRVLLQSKNNCDLLVADFYANDEMSPSGLHLNRHQTCVITANECFVADSNLMVITHHKFSSGCFHPSETITLPTITVYSNMNKLYIRGDELRVLLITRIISDVRSVGMYRYKISGDSSGKLSFTKNENNFYEEITYHVEPNLSYSLNETACFTAADIVYIKSASLIMYDPTVYQVMNHFNPQGIPASKDTRRIWNVPATEISCATYNSNYLVLGTNKGSVWVYEMKNIDDIVRSVDVNATPPKSKKVDLKGGRIFKVYIRYVEGVLRVIARGGFSLWYIDFSDEIKYKSC